MIIIKSYIQELQKLNSQLANCTNEADQVEILNKIHQIGRAIINTTDAAVETLEENLAF